MVEFLRGHWAVAGASVIVVALLLQAGWYALGRTPRARLRRAYRQVQERRSKVTGAAKKVARATRRCRRLEGKARSVSPAKLEQARGDLVDAERLLKIARDRVLVAENQLRTVIFEHFPPKRHDRLRARYLPDKDEKRYPFKFS